MNWTVLILLLGLVVILTGMAIAMWMHSLPQAHGFTLNKTISDCIKQFFGEDSERKEFENNTVDCGKVLG